MAIVLCLSGLMRSESTTTSTICKFLVYWVMKHERSSYHSRVHSIALVLSHRVKSNASDNTYCLHDYWAEAVLALVLAPFLAQAHDERPHRPAYRARLLGILVNCLGVLGRKANAFGHPFQLTRFSLPISGPLIFGQAASPSRQGKPDICTYAYIYIYIYICMYIYIYIYV